MIAYCLFFVCLGVLIATIFDYVLQASLVYALIVGRKQEVKWNFTAFNILLAVMSGLTAFLWHYNFGQ